jgi:sulfotransferase
MRQYHFITGLPRAGSTLLGGILLQNPKFHAGMSSPVGTLVNAVMNASRNNEFSVFMTDEKTRRLVNGVFDAYYDDIGEREIVFDTNRQWSAHLSLIDALAPGAKVIACVRDPAWVMDSVEQLVRKNPFQKSRLFQNDAERATVYSRSDTLARHDRLIGYAWSALKEAYYSDAADKLLLVEYDILCQRPEETMKLIYQFIGQPWFEHDFDNVEYSAEEFDEKLDTPGLHTVKRTVEWKPRRTVLPPDIFQRLTDLSFWRDGKGTKAHRIVEQPKSD